MLAKDLGGRGITVNTISPGPVDTPLFRAGKPPQVIDFISKQNPNGRLGLPEDIAPTVAFVASPAAQWLNGQNIRVNGVSDVVFIFLPYSKCLLFTGLRCLNSFRQYCKYGHL